MPPLTRGPLPARVYWRRRIVILSLAVLLVVGIARLLGSGSDATDPRARQVSASTVASTAAQTPAATVTVTAGAGKARHGGKHHRAKAPVLAEPDGPCSADDLVVAPEVEDAVAGRDVSVVLQLSTIESEACTWRVSPDALAVDITSGKDAIWSSRDCPHAIPRQVVTVRSAVTTDVTIVWKHAKRSDSDDCTARTGWALPGWYHVTAAALGGEPDDTQFELQTPSAPVITRTPEPHQSKRGGAGSEPSGSSSSTD